MRVLILTGPGQVPGIFGQDLEPSPTCSSYEMILKLRKTL